jgi:hypothetical protein
MRMPLTTEIVNANNAKVTQYPKNLFFDRGSRLRWFLRNIGTFEVRET